MKSDKIPTEFDLELKNINQILNMGGPWVGDVYVANNLVSESVLIDNLVYAEKYSTLFIVKYIYNSNRQKDNYFLIGVFNLVNNTLRFIGKKFDAVYINEILNENKLSVSESFHSFGTNKTIINWKE